MLSFYKVIENAYKFLENRDLIAYLYGGDGRICTEEYFEQWLKKYPNRIAPADLDRIRDFTIGKRVYDCSQLVITCFQCPDMTSAGLIKRCNPVTLDLSMGPEASVLYKKGHVGLDIGCGYAIDIPTEGQTVRVRRVNEGGWTQSGQLTIYCNYNGARAMDPNRAGGSYYYGRENK